MLDFNQINKSKIVATYLTLSEKQSYLDIFNKSVCTQAEFCKKHNLHLTTFNRWLTDKRVNLSAKITKIDDQEGHFVPLQLEEEILKVQKEIEPTLQAPSFLTLKTKVFSLEIPLGLDLEGSDFLKVKAVIQTLHDLA
jgi:hypothetical protein